MRQKKHLESSIALALAWRIFLSGAQPRSAQGLAASNAWWKITSLFCGYHPTPRIQLSVRPLVRPFIRPHF